MTELPYEENEKREIIFLLEKKDIQLNMKNEEGPWFLMERYLSRDIFYPQEAYKPRKLYEEILHTMQSVEFEHSMMAKSFAYSKFTVKKIISSEEWGLSPMKNYEVYNSTAKCSYQFNYWDYIQAFNKCLLYENPMRKHTWFIKMCYKVNNLRLPNWYFQWWQFYGPTEKILMEPFKSAFDEWAKCSTKLIALKEEYPQLDNIEPMLFFTEFSIPWILKDVEIGKNEQGLPCLKRKFYTKFWKKMADVNLETQQIFGLETLDHIKTVIKTEKLKKAQEEKQEMPDLFQQFQKMKGKNLSPEESIKEYLQLMKKDLIKNIVPQLSRPSSSSSSMNI